MVATPRHTVTMPGLKPYNKKHWLGKNLANLANYSISTSFFTNFYNFHNILYANELQFAKGFSAKLPTVLICQTFLLPKFFTVQYLWSRSKEILTNVLPHVVMASGTKTVLKEILLEIHAVALLLSPIMLNGLVSVAMQCSYYAHQH